MSRITVKINASGYGAYKIDTGCGALPTAILLHPFTAHSACKCPRKRIMTLRAGSFRRAELTPKIEQAFAW
jgi:hypothetical protein